MSVHEILKKHFPRSSEAERVAAAAEILNANYLVVKKKWGDAFIFVGVTDVGITFQLPLSTYNKALSQETGVNERLITSTADLIVREVKEESVKSYSRMGTKTIKLKEE